MKEERFFYVPDAESSTELPEEEARHAVKVLRLGMGDDIYLMDGKGNFFRASITAATGHRCMYRIEDTMPQERSWAGRIHLAMAPTKLNDRNEWMAEKATEIGMDELTFLDCQFSERRQIKRERIERIVVSAVKQSHKAWTPQVNDMTPFARFVKEAKAEGKFICHCYDEGDITPGARDNDKPLLWDAAKRGEDTVVMIGPEGDFSVEEVRIALKYGFRSVSLGKCRLRTETAAMAAVHTLYIINNI